MQVFQEYQDDSQEFKSFFSFVMKKDILLNTFKCLLGVAAIIIAIINICTDVDSYQQLKDLDSYHLFVGGFILMIGADSILDTQSYYSYQKEDHTL